MASLKIRNWDKWQSYRKDRGQPPWIKIHRCLMRDADWVTLGCQQRGQLVAIWLLAADNNGEIPADPTLIQKLCYMDSEPDINLFISMGFIDGDAVVTPTRRQHDAPETETETETEAETTSKNSDEFSPAPPAIRCPTQQIVNLYHEVLPNLPQCKKLTASRGASIRQRHLEDMEADLNVWKEYFEYVGKSDFLIGRTTPGNGRHKPFRATLDWLCKAENFAKIYEGKYHG